MPVLSKKDFNIQLAVTAGLALFCGITLTWGISGTPYAMLLAIVSGLSVLAMTWKLTRQYKQHERKVLFLLDAIENNDFSIHFPEQAKGKNNPGVNEALNRVARILYNVKRETAQREKYYELILDSVDTGIVVLNGNGMVYQKNDMALQLLGLNVFTHVKQLARTDKRLAEMLEKSKGGEKKQIKFYNERKTINLSIRVSSISIHDEILRLIVLNDINHELDEKEMDSWTRLTRVLTHEIMNAVTPITSLSGTLLTLAESSHPERSLQEIKSGLQTISSTGKGLLAFIDSYRKFTTIPTPQPTLFHIRPFLKRMADLAMHQYPGNGIRIDIKVEPHDLILYADEQLISQVITNLLKNAMQSILSSAEDHSQGLISINTYCQQEETIYIEVSDNGPAISPDIAEHIFIPFFTTKENGSGIGLSVSRQIMRLSGGSLTLLPGSKKTFLLRFD